MLNERARPALWLGRPHRTLGDKKRVVVCLLFKVFKNILTFYLLALRGDDARRYHCAVKLADL